MDPSTFTTDALLDLIARYQLIEAELLWRFVAANGGAAGLNPDPNEFVADLVRDGLLTEYQAEHLLADDESNLIIGKYHLLAPIGGLGSSVFRARHRRGSSNSMTPVRTQAMVAIKILSHHQDIPPTTVERFRREAQALALLDHPGIVGIKDSGEDNGRLYLVMEHIDGASIADIVQRQGVMMPALAVRIVHAALDAVDHIHRVGLIHRNLEPGHIMLDQAGNARIVDLGLARFLDDPGANLTMLNGHSQCLGSVEYQSPEQLVNSHDVDGRTDIYALGAILYYLLTGKAPFSQHALLRLAAGVVTHPQPLAQLRPDLPRDLVQVIDTMMACDRNLRYATPQDAKAALEAWLIQVSPPPLKVPRRPSANATALRPSASAPIRPGVNTPATRSSSQVDLVMIPKPAEEEVAEESPSGVANGVVGVVVFLAALTVALGAMVLFGGK